MRVIPEDADSVDTPAARLLDLGTAVAIEPRSGIELVTSLYGLAGDSAAALLADPADLCQPDVPVIPFEHDGRQGYLSFAGGYLVEASAPAVDFAAYDDTLLHISGSLEAPVWECSLPARLDSRRMWTTG